MEQYTRKSLTLSRVGIRLLPEEKMEVAVDMESGLTDGLEQRCASLMLTDKRLMRYAAGEHRSNVVSVSLNDVDSIEVKRTEKNYQWVAVGLVFIIGGLLLSLLSILLMATPLSPLLMAVSLTLIGAVFILTFIGELREEVVVRAGLNDIKCSMRPKALDDMALVCATLVQTKARVRQWGHHGQRPIRAFGRKSAVSDRQQVRLIVPGIVANLSSEGVGLPLAKEELEGVI